MSKKCTSIDIMSTTISGQSGRITLYLTDDKGVSDAFVINISQAEWLRHALKNAIKRHENK